MLRIDRTPQRLNHRRMGISHIVQHLSHHDTHPMERNTEGVRPELNARPRTFQGWGNRMWLVKACCMNANLSTLLTRLGNVSSSTFELQSNQLFGLLSALLYHL